MAELAELISQVAENGWLFNNLFQLHDRSWRCNLRFETEDRQGHRTYFHEYADAETATEAVTAAVWNMKQRRNPVGLNESTRLSMKRNEVARQMLDRALAALAT